MSENVTSKPDLFIYTDVRENFIVYYVLEIVIYIVTVVTNCLTIIVIACDSKLRIISNVFFVSLAASDLLQGIFGLTFNGMRLYGLYANSWTFISPTSSIALQFFWWFATNFSYTCLVLITVERWLFIACPLFYQRVWNRRAVIIILSVFLTLSLIGSILSVDSNMVSSNVGILFPIVHTFLCLIIISSYGHIIFISYRQQNAIRRMEAAVTNPDVSVERPGVMRRNWKALKMSLTVFAMYFLTVSPWTYFQAVQGYSTSTVDTSEISQALNSWSCVHFCSNFFVYASQNKDFNRVLKYYFFKVFSCFRTNSIGITTTQASHRDSSLRPH